MSCSLKPQKPWVGANQFPGVLTPGKGLMGYRCFGSIKCWTPYAFRQNRYR